MESEGWLILDTMTVKKKSKIGCGQVPILKMDDYDTDYNIIYK